jgi:tripartite-type tricarboxylate transporter receptor subunit TctC
MRVLRHAGIPARPSACRHDAVPIGSLRLWLLAIAASLAVAANGDFALAQTVEPFFQGKTINFYVGFAVGGSYDFYSRVAAQFLSRHIPGNPTIIVQNMPGAGSLQAAGFLYSSAPRDGTAIGMASAAVALEEALHKPGVRYKAAEFTWIGRITNSVEVGLTWKNSAKTIEQAKRMEVTMATTGAGSPSEGYPILLNALAGTRFKLISGFASSPQGMLAMERGEVDSVQTSYDTLKRTKQDWLRDHDVNMLFQCVTERDPELPDVPTTVELGPNQDARDLLEFYTRSAEVGQSILAPPDVPADRAEVLRTAFQAMLKDPDFLAEVAKTQVALHPAPAAAVQKIVAQTTHAPPGITDRVISILHSQ